jgi:ABC-type transport system substrate-binding protein
MDHDPRPATAAAAIQKGEVDWWELPPPDLLPLLAGDRDLKLATMQTAIGIMRFNQLHPPFDNPAIRRALLGAVDQATAMQASPEPIPPAGATASVCSARKRRSQTMPGSRCWMGRGTTRRFGVN